MKKLYKSLFKCLLDMIVSIVLGSIVLLPILIVLILPGVRIIKKKRVGLNQKVFSELRIRCPSNRWGRFIERAHLHRLPALWNILIRQMSFIGPRALSEKEAVALVSVATGPDLNNANMHPRFSVLPGFISPWWVRTRSNMTFDDEFSVDTDYVQNLCLKNDCGILLRALIADFYGKDCRSDDAETLTLLGVTIQNTTTAEAIQQVDQAIREKKTKRIYFVNADSLNKAFSSKEFSDVLNSGEIVWGDGIGVKIGAKLTKQSIRENVNGTDLFPRLCEHMSRQKQTLYLLGAREGVPELVRDWIAEHYSGVQVVGLRNGFFSPEENAEVCEDIRRSQPDVLLLAQGAPMQEQWIHSNMEQLSIPVAIGVGGLFDFYSGQTRRAPVWMREAGLEWFYRLMQEPQRMFKRYLIGNFLFIGRTVRFGRGAKQNNP